MSICMRSQCTNELTGKQSKYCSDGCKKSALRSWEHQRYKSEPNGKVCDECDAPLIGRQQRFCSNKCKCLHNYKNNKDSYHTNSYKSQHERGHSRKYELIKYKGNQCSVCGYDNNLAALVFHHINESTKSFNLDIRAISNRSMVVLYKEVDKCQLLCHNCHMELHYPYLNKTALLSTYPCDICT